LNLTCETIVFYLVGCYLNTFRDAGNCWGQALVEYFRMGSRDQKGWEPLCTFIGYYVIVFSLTLMFTNVHY